VTLIELCDDIDKLEKMSDEELRVYCEPYFKVTRPELAERAQPRSQSVILSPAVKHNAAKLAALGIDVSGLFKRKKR